MADQLVEEPQTNGTSIITPKRAQRAYLGDQSATSTEDMIRLLGTHVC